MAKEQHELSKLELDEVSLVDSGANQHAKVVLFKRDAAKCMMGGEVEKCSYMKSGQCSKKDCPMYSEEEEIEKAPAGVKFTIGFKEEGGSEVQSVIFDSDVWTPEEARAWLKNHDMESGKLDETANTLRFRQKDPEGFSRFRVVTPGKQVAKALRMKESFNQLQTAVNEALRRKFQQGSDPISYLWIRDLYRDVAVFDQDGTVYQTSYEIVRGGDGQLQVTVGEKVPVEVVYQVIKNQPKQPPASLEMLLRIGKMRADLALLKARLNR